MTPLGNSRSEEIIGRFTPLFDVANLTIDPLDRREGALGLPPPCTAGSYAKIFLPASHLPTAHHPRPTTHGRGLANTG